MGNDKGLYLVCYDIRDPQRWRKVFKLIKGYGISIQYSVFRCYLTKREAAKLKFEMEELLDKEDDLLVVSLCSACASKISVKQERTQHNLLDKPPSFRIID